ncbi:MAG TPA: sugar phosphate nucleotidyltransferase [Methylomirabilota bacterium]|jgi:mannose-1-phosphate guanylyltransferase
MAGGRRPWAVVLSGGEGAHLRPLVRQVLGQERPAQYVPLLGPRSLLRQTLDRVALGVSPERTIVVTVRAHTAYIAEEFRGCAAPPYVLVQPEDRGSAAGALYATHWIGWREPEATVAIFPSDHFVLGEATLMAQVLDAARALDRHPGRIVLLGAPAAGPAGEDGWIEPGEPLDDDGALSTVRGLRAKPADSPAPSPGLADGLWNTAIVVARARTLVGLGELALPDLSRRLAGIGRFAGGDDEPAAVHQAYALMPRARFCRDLLAPHPEHLAVCPLQRVTWSDLGSARRVADVLTRARVRPSWAEPVDPSAIPA